MRTLLRWPANPHSKRTAWLTAQVASCLRYSATTLEHISFLLETHPAGPAALNDGTLWDRAAFSHKHRGFNGWLRRMQQQQKQQRQQQRRLQQQQEQMLQPRRAGSSQSSGWSTVREGQNVEQPMQQRQHQQGQELPPFDQQRMERPPLEQRGAQQNTVQPLQQRRQPVPSDDGDGSDDSSSNGSGGLQNPTGWPRPEQQVPADVAVRAASLVALLLASGGLQPQAILDT